MTPLEAFRKIASEFAGKTDEDIQGWLEFAEPFVSKGRFSTLYPYALACYAAHLVKLDQVRSMEQSGSAAAAMVNGIKQEKEGELSVTYQDAGDLKAAAGVDTLLLSTSYGREFAQLAKRCRLPGLTRMNGDISIG